MELYPNDYHLIFNDVIYPNQEVETVLNSVPQRKDSYSIFVPNRGNIGPGKQMLYFQTRGIKMKVRVKLDVFNAPYPIEIPTSQTSLGSQVTHEALTSITFDFNKQRICPKCNMLTTFIYFITKRKDDTDTHGGMKEDHYHRCLKCLGLFTLELEEVKE